MNEKIPTTLANAPKAVVHLVYYFGLAIIGVAVWRLGAEGASTSDVVGNGLSPIPFS